MTDRQTDEITWLEYRAEAAKFRRYPEPGWIYPAFGLIEEVGEFVQAPIDQLVPEAGDVYWNVAMLELEFGCPKVEPIPCSLERGIFKFAGVAAKYQRLYVSGPDERLAALRKNMLGLAQWIRKEVHRATWLRHTLGPEFFSLDRIIMHTNLAKLRDRAARNVIVGEGDKR
jgi:hypothetical protein